MRDSYEARTAWEKLVADYCGCSLFEVGSLPVVDYLALRRDAFIHMCRKTEKGVEYLENARVLAATEADTDALREAFGVGRANG